MLFSFSLYDAMLQYQTLKQRRVSFEKLITYLNEHAQNKSVYFFTTYISHVYPIIIYTPHTRSASRFPFFWSLPGLVKQAYLPMDNQLQQRLNTDKQSLIHMVAEDLRDKKPALIFIDVLEQKNSLYFTETQWGVTYRTLILIPFNYLNYFQDNQAFNAQWKHYRFLTTLSEPQTNPVYTFDVYTRIDSD